MERLSGIDKGLPAALDAEKFVLGGILVEPAAFKQVAEFIGPDDFALEKHRRIFGRMVDLDAKGTPIDTVTLTNALRDAGQLESVDGMSYLVSLDEGLPKIVNLDHYAKIVRDKSLLRKVVYHARSLADQACSGADVLDVITRAGQFSSELNKQLTEESQWSTPGEVIEQYAGGLNAFLSPTREGTGIPTPWPKLTEMLCGGFRPGDLVIVAGRPSMGKSCLALQIARCAAGKGFVVPFFALEMGKDALVRRLISEVGLIDSFKLRSGRLSKEERLQAQAIATKIADLPLYIVDKKCRTMPAIEGHLNRLCAHHKIGMVIVDHLQLMQGVGRTESRHHELSAISHDMKSLAKSLNAPVVLLSQLNRDCERGPTKREPYLSDLKETGSIEEDADIVAFIHREEVYQRDHPELRGLADMILAKQRDGPIGRVGMLFRHQFLRFDERTFGGGA